jgi:hypothetical protein
MSCYIRVVLNAILTVLPLLAQATPVDVDADGIVGPQEIIDLSMNWKGPAGVQPWQVNGTSIFYDAGVVGIGTANPVTRFQVNDGRIRLSNSQNSNRWDIFQADSGNLFKIEQNAAFGLLSIIGGAEGRVGIGTETPAAGTKLHAINDAANGVAILGDSPNGNGVVGKSAGTGFGATSGSNTGLNGIGVYGEANSGSTASGVYGKTNNGYGVYGLGDTGYGVFGKSPNGVAVHGESTGNIGVEGTSTNDSGVSGVSTNSNGVTGASANGIGVYGVTSYNVDSNLIAGVVGEAISANVWAGIFLGSVDIRGNLQVSDTIFNKSSGSVRIDHPLDPANKYLQHSSVESPDMKNIYDGNVTTDDKGYAEVKMPDYFEALNKNFRYQLTVIGQFAQAIVAEEIHDNRFSIKTDKPNVKVSWQVTGIRNDRYAKAHPVEVEKLKSDGERGKYLSPEVFGQPREMGIGYRVPPKTEISSGAVSKGE